MIREMRFALVLLFEAIAVASLAGAGWSTWRATSSFHLWFWPLFEAGELPAGGRLPALETWQRLLGDSAEDELVAEQRRCTTKLWTIRAAKYGGAFALALGLSVAL
jgi:hypothetical protein